MECRHIRCTEREGKRGSVKYPTLRHLRQHEKRGWLHPCNESKDAVCKCCLELERKGVRVDTKRPVRDKRRVAQTRIQKNLKQKRGGIAYPVSSALYGGANAGSYAVGQNRYVSSTETAVLLSTKKPFRLPTTLPQPEGPSIPVPNPNAGQDSKGGETPENFVVRSKNAFAIPIARLPLVLPPPVPPGMTEIPMHLLSQQKDGAFMMGVFNSALHDGEGGNKDVSPHVDNVRQLDELDGERAKQYVGSPGELNGGPKVR